MLTIIRILIMLVVIAFAIIGVGLVFVLWHIKQHPMSVLYCSTCSGICRVEGRDPGDSTHFPSMSLAVG